MPYVNLRVIGCTVVGILLLAGSVYGWLKYQERPDTLYRSAEDYYQKGEKANKAKDTKTARADYEKARTLTEKFLDKTPPDEPRRSQAYMLRYKIMRPLAVIVDQDDRDANTPIEQRQANMLKETAFLSAERAAAIDNKNVEALAVVLDDHFRRNEFRQAYPYARALIDNLPNVESQPVQLEGFDNYVVGAYYILAMREVEDKPPHPDKALQYLADSLEREQKAAGPGKPAQPRWRAVALEIEALSQKVEQLRKQPAPNRRGSLVKAEDQLRDQVVKYVARVRAELTRTIPPADGKPEEPLLATLTETNAKGLIDFLLLSVRTAVSYPFVSERAVLLLDVCEKLAGSTGAAHWIYDNAIRGAQLLAKANDRVPAGERLKPEEMSKLQVRVVAINDAVLKNGGTIDPRAYLEMSRTAAKEKDGRPRALALVRTGLDAANAHHIAPSAPAYIELQAQAAWLLLLDHKVKEADEYLDQISKQQRLVANVHYMKGLGAVLDGRLDEGVKHLREAQKLPSLKDNLPLLLGLAHAYLGEGQLENALPLLEQLARMYKDQRAKNLDDDFWIETWLPTVNHVNLDLMKCHLELALKATNREQVLFHLDRVRKDLYPELQKTLAAEDATAAMLNYQLARLRMATAKDPGGLGADIIRQDIHKIIDALPASSRGDPRLLWSEVNVILSERETDPPTIAGAVAAAIGAPTDMAVRLGELGRLRAGYNWQWQKAEEHLMRVAAGQKDSLATQLAWVRWLQMNGRTEEAVAKVSELEDHALSAEEKRRLQAARARLLLSSGQTKEADDIIQQLRKDGDDLNVEMIYVQELLQSGNAKAAEEVVNKALSKHDQSGLYHFWQGQVHQSKGDYHQAIQSYERSLEFVQLKGLSENGIVGAILGILSGPPGKPEKADPAEAFKEAQELRKGHPTDQAVLIAFAITARTMDKVYGEDGMEGALADLSQVIKDEQPAAAAIGPYNAARQWVAAGRPDRARQELKAHPGHLPSLLLATQLAVNDGDWTEVAADLKRLKVRQPDAVDLPLWEAQLHEVRGELIEAKEIYEKFLKDHKESNAGYLGLARVHEHAKEYDKALVWIRKWRKEMPGELHGINALVRVLALQGQAADAVKEADIFIKEQLKKAGEAMDEAERKNPIKETDKDKIKEETDRRAKLRDQALVLLDLSVTQQVVESLQKGKAYAEAEKWLTSRAEPLLEKLPEETRKGNRIVLQLTRAALNMERGQQLKEGAPERVKLMDLAIADYDAVWKSTPGNLIAGNNLAWLLVKEKHEPARALELVLEVRKGKYSQQPVSAERLPLEFLDTLGVVLRSNDKNKDALTLFKEALVRYAREPRVVMHLGLSQKALGLKQEAQATFKAVIDLADNQAKATPDPVRKEKLAKLSEDARAEQKEMSGTR